MAWRGEVEDGTGWGGLVASKAEQRAEARQAALEKDAQRYRKLRNAPAAAVQWRRASRMGKTAPTSAGQGPTWTARFGAGTNGPNVGAERRP